MATISEYYPERWDWKGDTSNITAGVSYRNALPYDIQQIRRFCRRFGAPVPKELTILRWIRLTGYTIWLAVRNEFNIVGVIACRTDRGVNEIIRLVLNPYYRTRKELLSYAVLEMPEQDTTIVVPDSDLEAQTALRELGWAAQEKADRDSWTFRHPAILTFKPRPVDEAGADDGEQDSGEAPRS